MHFNCLLTITDFNSLPNLWLVLKADASTCVTRRLKTRMKRSRISSLVTMDHWKRFKEIPSSPRTSSVLATGLPRSGPKMFALRFCLQRTWMPTWLTAAGRRHDLACSSPLRWMAQSISGITLWSNTSLALPFKSRNLLFNRWKCKITALLSPSLPEMVLLLFLNFQTRSARCRTMKRMSSLRYRFLWDSHQLLNDL